MFCFLFFITLLKFHQASEDNQEFSYYKNHEHIHPKTLLMQKININPDLTKIPSLGGSDNGALTVDKTVVSSPNEVITVSWINISYPTYYDWIGLYNYSEDDPMWFTAAPIKFQYVCPKGTCKTATQSGSIKFELLNRRTNYAFVYYGGDTQYGEVQAISPMVTYNNLYEPMHIHIAIVSPFNNENSLMPNIQINWIQKEINNPIVNYGLQSDKLINNVKASSWINFQRNDLCDAQYGLPAGTLGYFILGYSITAYLENLEPNTLYFYQVSDEIYGTSKINNFTSPPKYGELTNANNIKMIAFGDLGNMAIDYSHHHSWDWNNEGELYSINTTHTISNYYINGPIESSNLLLHIGDISYAVGYMSEWDDFMYQIESIANFIPYMTGIGNHEYSWSNEWKPSSNYVTSDAYSNADGGGECGIPYNMYFSFANINGSNITSLNPNLIKPWYTIDYGIIRVIMMSTEHDYSQGSLQYQYIEHILNTTNRQIFPWIFITGHRPMYANSGWDGDVTTSQYLRLSLESLFNQYKVAGGFWGHQHSYSRTCNVYNTTCQTNQQGTTQIVMGMAGYELTSSIPSDPANYYMFTSNKYYGFLHFTIFNITHCFGKFINSQNASIIESFWIVNPYHGT